MMNPRSRQAFFAMALAVAAGISLVPDADAQTAQPKKTAAERVIIRPAARIMNGSLLRFRVSELLFKEVFF